MDDRPTTAPTAAPRTGTTPGPAALEIDRVDPTDDSVRPILEAHLAFTHGLTPGEHVHALDLAGLVDPRRGGAVSVLIVCSSRLVESPGRGAS